MAKKRGILHWDTGNKGKSSLTGWNSFVFESTLPSSIVDFVPCDQLVQKAHCSSKGSEKLVYSVHGLLAHAPTGRGASAPNLRK